MDGRNMECRDARKLADSFADGELIGESNLAFVSHLESCETCRADSEGRRALRARLRGAMLASTDLAPRAEWSAGLAERL